MKKEDAIEALIKQAMATYAKEHPAGGTPESVFVYAWKAGFMDCAKCMDAGLTLVDQREARRRGSEH